MESYRRCYRSGPPALNLSLSVGRELILGGYLIVVDTQCIVFFMLYNRIAVLRSERSLSRADLARVTGVNVQTIGFLERGDYSPSLELAFKISGYFKLPVEAVFSPEPFRPLSEQVYEMHRREA